LLDLRCHAGFSSSGIFERMVDRNLARRIEKNRAAQANAHIVQHRALRPDLGAESIEVAGGIAACGGPLAAPSTTKAVGLGLDGPVTASDLDRVETFYSKHGCRPRISVTPWTDLSLYALLAARRWVAIDFDSVLVRAFTSSQDLGPSPSGIVVREVPRHLPDVLAWGQLVRRGMELDTAVEVATSIDAPLAHSPEVTCFLASIDGVDAGGAAMVLRDGIVTLFATSTLPPYRRRGVQRALALTRLARARDAGVDYAIVLTEPGSESQRNLETNLGFRVGYTTTIFAAPETAV
jgi:GNAT superfamily N-acetyltransferase